MQSFGNKVFLSKMWFCWTLGEFMAKVLLTLKILPSDINVNIKELKEKIVKKINSVSIEEEPIAFGLVALIASILIEDKEGEVERIEKIIKEVEGVGEVEVIEVTRTL